MSECEEMCVGRGRDSACCHVHLNVLAAARWTWCVCVAGEGRGLQQSGWVVVWGPKAAQTVRMEDWGCKARRRWLLESLSGNGWAVQDLAWWVVQAPKANARTNACVHVCA